MPRFTVAPRFVVGCFTALVFATCSVTTARAEIFVMNWSELGITKTTGTSAAATQYWQTTYSNGIGFNHTNNNVYYWGADSSNLYAVDASATASSLLWNYSTVASASGNDAFAIGVDLTGRIYASAANNAAIVRSNADGSSPSVWFNATSTYSGMGGTLVPLLNGDIVTIAWQNGSGLADLIRIPAHSGLSSSYSVIAANLPGDSNWVAVDPNGNYYVSRQWSDIVMKVLPNGTTSNFITGLNRPTGLAFDKGLNQLLVNNFSGGDVLRYDLSGNQVGTYGSGYNGPYFIAAEATFVPEPSTCAMALAGLSYAGYSMWRRRTRPESGNSTSGEAARGQIRLSKTQ
jgi:hypothetical protein